MDFWMQSEGMEDQLPVITKERRVNTPAPQAPAPSPAAAPAPSPSTPRARGAQADISRLYFAIHAARRGDQPLIVQFVGAAGREGVSTIAEGFAAQSAREPRAETLILGCGAPTAAERESLPRLLEQFRAGEKLRGVRVGERLHRAALSLSPERELDPTALPAFAAALRGAWSLIVLDCPPVETSPVAGIVSRIADGTIVVVEAGRTPRRALERTTAEIARMGGEVSGFVLNRQRDHLPAWLRRRMG
jgi:Mrp family chromosome partitioning ATPase